MVSKNHILIDGSGLAKTRYGFNGLDPDVYIIVYEKDDVKSPIAGMTASDYEERLYAIRRTLCKVNRTMRFPNAYDDLAVVAREYEAACLKFFAPRIA